MWTTFGIYWLIINCSVQGLLNQHPLDLFNSSDSLLNKWTDVEVINIQDEKDITLNCKSHKCHKYGPNDWEFAPCKNCHRKESLEWSKVPKKKSCNPQLHIKNVTRMNNNGLYRCMVDNKVVSTYLLNITDNKETLGLPKIVEIIITPNSTIEARTNLVIRCKVSSKQVPTFLWFKQTDDHQNAIEYKNNTYTLITNASQLGDGISQEEFVYMSKLNLQNVTLTDSGIYVCLSMTRLGKDVRYFSVNVLQQSVEKQTSLAVLFLMPLGFALLPASCWFCYYKRRSFGIKSDTGEQPENIMSSEETRFLASKNMYR